MSFTYPYPRPSLTVDAIVIAVHKGCLHILLVRRRFEPFIDEWALPGGFVNIDETLEAACVRELKEETGIDLAGMEQFRVFDAIKRDPRGRTVSVVFYTYLPEIVEVHGGDDAYLACWFPVSDLPKLAFDHTIIISQFVESR